MGNYREQSDAHIEKYIGRIYPKVVVGCLDDGLSLYASITHALVAQGDPGTTRNAYPVPMRRTKRGIYVAPDKNHYMAESRAVIIGIGSPDELDADLAKLKRKYNMDGILYMVVLPDGSVEAARYVNHTQQKPEVEKVLVSS